MPFSKSCCTECGNALMNIISRCCPFINDKKQEKNEVNRNTKLELNENHCDNENKTSEINIKSLSSTQTTLSSSPLVEKQFETNDSNDEIKNSPGTSQKQLKQEQPKLSTQAASSSSASSSSPFSSLATTSKSTKMITTTKSNTTAVNQSRGPLRHKIVVLGDGGVGKSALTLQFVTHSFLEYHDPTIEDSYQQQSMIDGQTALLDILDTAGQVEFTAMRDQYMRCGDGFIICYSIIDRRSFDEIEQYYRQIHRLRGHENNHLPIVMVGNKCDLEHLRQISTEEGQSLALKLNCPFFETSAALKHQVEEVFYNLVRLIRDKDENYSNPKRTHLRALKNWRIVIAVLNFITKRKD